MAMMTIIAFKASKKNAKINQLLFFCGIKTHVHKIKTRTARYYVLIA